MLGGIANFFGLPGAPVSANPTIAAFGLLTRLTLDDWFGGAPVPSGVTNPATVITGLFEQVLRKDPSSDELQNYLGVWNLTGINGVVASLYSSTEFRQTEVNNYYLELLGRNANQIESAWGISALTWGIPEPLFAATIAGTGEFFNASSSSGGAAGVPPSPTTFVNLMYRSMLGTTADPTTLENYVKQLDAGLPSGLVATEFVTSAAFRAAKIQEIYQVVYGRNPTVNEVADTVDGWFWSGGLAGIAAVSLASAANVERINAGLVSLPDMGAVADLTTLLLATYNDSPDGFVSLFNTLLGASENAPCPSSPTCNTALYNLLTTGGPNRGIPNTAIQNVTYTANIATLVPSQSQIDLKKSLERTLQDPARLQSYLDGGVIDAGVLTMDGGAYIVDGHHRWSAVYLINPEAQTTARDIGYVPNPQAGLEESQIGVATWLGYIKTTPVPPGSYNVFTVDRPTFNDQVALYITSNPDPQAEQDVLGEFGAYLGYSDLLPEDQKLALIENFLWNNVLRMRSQNPPIAGAPSRAVMPQVDNQQLVVGYMTSGLLSFSFPIISYLG